MCVSLPGRFCSLENCLALYYCGVDFRISGDFVVLKRTVPLFILNRAKQLYEEDRLAKDYLASDSTN